MAISKHQRLVDALIDRTRAGNIPWKLSASDNAYIFNMHSGSVRLEKTLNSLFDDLYVIELLNDSGEVSDRFNDEDLFAVSEAAGDNRKWFPVLAELFELAERSAKGSDRLLDELLNEVESIIPF